MTNRITKINSRWRLCDEHLLVLQCVSVTFCFRTSFSSKGKVVCVSSLTVRPWPNASRTHHA